MGQYGLEVHVAFNDWHKEVSMRVSLTFDDGPNTVTSPRLLDVLEKYNTRASFFLIGNNIHDDCLPVMERQLKDGCSIECHSWSHPAFPDLTAEQMLKEIDDTNSLIEKNLGWKTKFFRPPYIALNQLMYDTIKMPFICGRGVEDWNMDIPTEVKAKGVIDNVKDGQIILLHDMTGNQTTVDAVDIIIPTLLERGVEFYNVRELFDVCNVNPFKANTIWTDVLED